MNFKHEPFFEKEPLRSSNPASVGSLQVVDARGPDDYAFPPGSTYLLPDQDGNLVPTAVSAGIKMVDYNRIKAAAEQRRREVDLERNWS